MPDYFAYINLERNLDRRKFMESQFQNLGIKAERIPAKGPDGEKMDQVSGVDSRFNLKGDLTSLNDGPPQRKFELGLLCSHMEALRRFVKSGQEYGVIFEDDATLPSKKINCSRIMANAPPGAETVLLFSFPRDISSIRDMQIANDKNRPFIKWTQNYFSSLAFIITQKGAERCLKSCGATEPGRILCFNSYPVSDHVIYNKTSTYVLSCPIVFPREDFSSTIHESHDTVNRKFTMFQKQKTPCKIIETFTQKSNLVFSSVGDNTVSPEKWRLANSSYDIVQIRYSGDLTEHDAYFNKASKFQNLLQWVRKDESAIQSYDYVLVLDDDISLSPEEIDLLFRNAAKYNSLVASPSFDPVRGKISPTLEIMANVTGSNLRRTNYVEVTAPLFERKTLEKFLNFYEPHADILTCWGVDHLFRHFLWSPAKPFCIFDDVIAVNPREPDKPKGLEGGREIDTLISANQRREAWYSVADKLNIPRHVNPMEVSSPRLQELNIIEFLRNKVVPKEEVFYLVKAKKESMTKEDYDYIWKNDGWVQVNMGRVICTGSGWLADKKVLVSVESREVPVMVLGGCIIFSGEVLKRLRGCQVPFKKIEKQVAKHGINMVLSVLFRISGVIMKSVRCENAAHGSESSALYEIIDELNKEVKISVVTPTYKREKFLKKLLECLKAQSAKHGEMEWVIFDDSPEINQDAQNGTGIYSNLDFRYYYYWTSEWNRIGKKRNIMNRLALGKFIICFDDDDLHHPDRIKHSVSKLNSNPEINLAGSTFSFLGLKNNGYVSSKESNLVTIKYLDGTTERKISDMKVGERLNAKTATIYKIIGKKGMGFGRYHSTAGLMAYKRDYAISNKFGEDVAYAEEPYFTNKFNEPMIQLDPWKIILITCHENNTYDKISYVENGIVPKWCARVINMGNYELEITFYPEETLENCLSLIFYDSDKDNKRRLSTDITSENLNDDTLFINCQTGSVKLYILLGPREGSGREIIKSVVEYNGFKMNISPYEFVKPSWKNKERTVWGAKLTKWSGGKPVSLSFDAKNKVVQINDQFLDARPHESWYNGSVKIVWESESTTGISSIVKAFEVIIGGGKTESAILEMRSGYRYDFIQDVLINAAGWILEEPFYDGKSVYKMSKTKVKEFTKNKGLIKMFGY